MQPSKVMKILKSINRELPEALPNSIIKSSIGKIITKNKQKAEIFRKVYKEESTKSTIPTNLRNQEKERKSKTKQYINKVDNSPIALNFNLDKLNIGISYLKSRKACGSDRICNEFLIKSNTEIRIYILNLFNLIWKSDTLTRLFKNSNIITIYKGGNKPKFELKSYRSIALTSYLYKLIERLVINSLVYYIEKNKLFKYVQLAHYIAYSTLDPLMRLVANINKNFNLKPFNRTLAMQLDLISAFNYVEHEKLLSIIDDLNIPPYFRKFCKGFLIR